ncbi:MAG: pyrroloquinoline quinone biosynthesis protein PqqB [Acidiphilium sp.]|nr:pyrroloquinoline quinone biosynthesis protein PqqB [Acidiphilium sp.]MDD4935980.1 pyrroloquinoline quinone biosynthesis protein PqqB [Acidiphilium sp.]
MKLIILGAAAGGGFPQWNCACRNCARARAGDAAAQPRTQASLAVSANGADWVLFNASPDLRAQILATPALHPRGGLRDSPIQAVVLTGGDVDFTAGLLNLREGQTFGLYAGQRILDLLDANSIFRVLDAGLVPRRPLATDTATVLRDAAGRELGLTVEAFVVPGKVALYAEDASRPDFGSSAGDTVGLHITDAGGRGFFYIPACATLSDDVARRVRGSALVLFDGTLWLDDEMISLGLSAKTGARMGHISVSGARGTIAGFAELGVARKVFVHINNSNPMIIDDTPERKIAETAGWTVAYDGMEIIL